MGTDAHSQAVGLWPPTGSWPRKQLSTIRVCDSFPYRKKTPKKKRKKNPSLKIQKLRTENLGELALTAAFCSVASLLGTTHCESLEFNPPILQMTH